MSIELYRERAHLIAHLAAIYPATISTDPLAPDWPVVTIELATGQACWHIAEHDMDLFAHVPHATNTWDGHTTAEKYQRLAEATRLLAEHPHPSGTRSPDRNRRHP